MSKFVVKAIDCQSNFGNEYVFFNDIHTGEGLLSTLENSTIFLSKEEANKALRNYITFYCGVLKYEYIVQEIEEEQVLSEKTYYVLHYINRNGIEQYQTIFGTTSMYLDKAQKFPTMEQAIEALSIVHGFDIYKIVETTTSKKIDHKSEVKKAEKTKLESQKKELKKRLSDLNNEIISIKHDIERIEDELQLG